MQWWNGYGLDKNHTDYIILDDFRKGWCDFEELLLICQGFPHPVEIKGGMTCLQPKVILISCPRDPDHEFKVFNKALNAYTANEDIMQINRRLYKIVNFDNPTEVAACHRPTPEEYAAWNTERPVDPETSHYDDDGVL